MNGYTRRQELTCTLEELATYPDKVLLNNEALYNTTNGYDIKFRRYKCCPY